MPDFEEKDRLKLFFDGAFRLESEEGEKRKEWFKSIISKYAKLNSGRALDIACGTGISSFALAECGFSVIGIDNNAQYLALSKRYAKRLAYDCEFLLMDLRQISFPHNSFDLVAFLGDPLSLFPLNAIDLLMAKSFEILKTGGRIFLNYRDWIRISASKIEDEFKEIQGEKDFYLDTRTGKLVLVFHRGKMMKPQRFEFYLASPFLVEFLLYKHGFADLEVIELETQGILFPEIVTTGTKPK
jgi:SAM-dependent methyltransferase